MSSDEIDDVGAGPKRPGRARGAGLGRDRSALRGYRQLPVARRSTVVAVFPE